MITDKKTKILFGFRKNTVSDDETVIGVEQMSLQSPNALSFFMDKKGQTWYNAMCCIEFFFV